MQNLTKHNLTNKFQKKQTLTATALILMMTFGLFVVAAPSIEAQTYTWVSNTWAYLSVTLALPQLTSQ